MRPPTGPAHVLWRAAAPVFLAAWMGMLFAVNAGAQPVAPTVEAVEAAYIHKLAGYIEWPPRLFAGPAAPLVVGVVGSDTIHDLLNDLVVGRPVQGRSVEVRRLSRPDQRAGVHLVFVGKDAWKDLAAWSRAAQERGTVVTTDAPQGLDQGAVLAFVQKDQRVRFELSLPAAERAGVKMSSRLLAVAERVVGARP